MLVILDKLAVVSLSIADQDELNAKMFFAVDFSSKYIFSCSTYCHIHSQRPIECDLFTVKNNKKHQTLEHTHTTEMTFC